MTPPNGLPQVETMAWTIDHSGIGAIPVAALRELGVEADRFGVPTVVTDVLLDSSAPRVARDRAFGFIATALAGGRIASLTSVAHAA